MGIPPTSYKNFTNPPILGRPEPLTSPITSADKYGTGYFPIISADYYERDINRYKAQNQSDWDKFGNMLGRGILKTGVSIIEPLPYLLDIEQYTSDINQIEDVYGNDVSASLRNLEKSIDESMPIYTEEDQPRIFSGDWWFRNGDQVLKSLGYFVPGMAITKGASMGLKALGASQSIIKWGGLATGAVAQNYSEHMYSAAIAFEQNKVKYFDFIKKQNPNISDEMAMNEAKKLAAKDAEGIIVKGKANILLNMIEYNNLFKIGGLSRSATSLFSKGTVKELLETAGSEAWEEMNTGVFESEAQRNVDLYTKKIYDDGSTPVDRALQHFGSYEGITEGLLGAIGGAGMQFISNLTNLGARKVARENIMNIKNQYGDFNALANTERNTFISSLFESAQKGTYSTMMSVLEDIRNTSNDVAKEKGYKDNFKETADEYLDIAKNFELEYNKTMHKYSEDPNMGIALVNLRTNRDTNRKEALKAERDITNLNGQYTEAEKQHPLFALKQLSLQAASTVKALEEVGGQIAQLEQSNTHDRTLDSNESMEDLLNRQEVHSEEYNSILEKNEALRNAYIENRKTNKVSEAKALKEIEDYLSAENEIDIKLHEAYRLFGEAMSKSNVAAKTVSELEKSDKKLREYTDRNLLAEKKVLNEFKSKLINAKTQDDVTAIEKEYTHNRFKSYTTAKRVEIKKQEDKDARIKKEADKKAKLDAEVLAKQQASSQPKSSEDILQESLTKIKTASKEDITTLLDEIDETGFNKDQKTTFDNAVNDRLNTLSQSSSSLISSRVQPSSEPSSEPSNKSATERFDKNGKPIVTDFESIIEIPGDQLEDYQSDFLTTLSKPMLEIARKEISESSDPLKTVKSHLKEFDELMKKPAFSNPEVRAFLQDQVRLPLEARKNRLENDKAEKELLDKKDNTVSEPIIEEDDNFNPGWNEARTIPSTEEGPIEEVTLKLKQGEPSITLAMLDTPWTLNALLQKKTAANSKAINYIKELSSKSYWLPGDQIRISIDTEHKLYKEHKDNPNMVPLKVETKTSKGWIGGAWLHTTEWINNLNVVEHKVDEEYQKLAEIRKELIIQLSGKEDYVYDTIKQKTSPFAPFNIKMKEVNGELAAEVNNDRNPIVEQLLLSEAMPDPKLQFVVVKNGEFHNSKDAIDQDLVGHNIDLSNKSGMVYIKVQDTAGNWRILPLSIESLSKQSDVLNSIVTIIKAFYSQDQPIIDNVNKGFESIGSRFRIDLTNPKSLWGYINTFINLKEVKTENIGFVKSPIRNTYRIAMNKDGNIVFGNDMNKPNISKGVGLIKDKNSFINNETKLIEHLTNVLMSVKLTRINQPSQVYEVLLDKQGSVSKAIAHDNYNSFVKTFTKTWFNGRNKVDSTGEYIYFINPMIRIEANFMPKEHVGINEEQEIINLEIPITETSIVESTEEIKEEPKSKPKSKPKILPPPGEQSNKSTLQNITIPREDIEEKTFDGTLQNIISSKIEKNINEEQSPLNTKLINFLKELGVTIEVEESLKDITGYNILSATDLLTKTIFLAKQNNYKSIPKEAAYLIFQFLGKKNILRKDLIASIHLLDGYEDRLRKYQFSNLSDYKKRELVVIDYLHDQLITNFNTPVQINKIYESKDATAKNQLEYIILKIKQWWNNIIRDYFIKYKKNEIQAVINQISQDVLNQNYRLFATTQKQTNKLLDVDSELAKNPKMKEIFDNFKKLGFIPSGSYALARQGKVYRTSLHDLDFIVPYSIISESTSKSSLINKIKELYPNVKINPEFNNLYNNAITQIFEIDGVNVDLFYSISPSENFYITDNGLQNWESIFDAKIRIGSKKHLNDLFNFVPFEQKTNFRRGLRHFNFDFIKSNYNQEYNTNENTNIDFDSETTKSFAYPEELIIRAKSFLISEGLLEKNKGDINKPYIIKEYNGNESIHFNTLLHFHNNNYDKAIVDFYKTFSNDFNSWYGKLDSRIPNITHTFRFGTPNSYNKPSIFIDSNNAPLVLYHGAGTKFDTFSKEYFMSGEGAMVYGAGFYGTTYRPTADQYAETSKALSVRIQQLFDERDSKLQEVLDKLGLSFEDNGLLNTLNSYIPNLISSVNSDDSIDSEEQKKYELLRDLLGIHETKYLYIHLTNPLDWFSPIRPHIRNLISSNFGIDMIFGTEGEMYNTLKSMLKISDTELSSRLYNIGIDGTIHETRGGTTGAGVQHIKGELHFVIFEPIQAKAVNNSGLFSKTNANIFDPVNNIDINIGNDYQIDSDSLDKINSNLALSILNKQYTLSEFNALPKEEQEYLIKCWS